MHSFDAPPLLLLAAGDWSVVSALLLAGIVALGVRVLQWLGKLDRRLARLEDVAARASRAEPATAPRPLELGRVEGLLEDLRDVQRRLDDRLSALAERASAPPTATYVGGPAPMPAPVPDSALLVERALNRLLALGYEQIEVVTPRDEVAPDGSVIVEARRFGAVHKGEVRLVGGSVVDVELRPSHGLFP